jgi:hypothetical protein
VFILADGVYNKFVNLFEFCLMGEVFYFYKAKGSSVTLGIFNYSKGKSGKFT